MLVFDFFEKAHYYSSYVQRVSINTQNPSLHVSTKIEDLSSQSPKTAKFQAFGSRRLESSALKVILNGA